MTIPKIRDTGRTPHSNSETFPLGFKNHRQPDHIDVLRSAFEKLTQVLKPGQKVQETVPTENGSGAKGASHKGDKKKSSTVEQPQNFYSTLPIPKSIKEVDEIKSIDQVWQSLDTETQQIVLNLLQNIPTPIPSTNPGQQMAPGYSDPKNLPAFTNWKNKSLGLESVDIAAFTFGDDAPISVIEIYTIKGADGKIIKTYSAQYNPHASTSSPVDINTVVANLKKIIFEHSDTQTHATFLTSSKDSGTSFLWQIDQKTSDSEPAKTFTHTPPDKPRVSENLIFDNPLEQYYNPEFLLAKNQARATASDAAAITPSGPLPTLLETIDSHFSGLIAQTQWNDIQEILKTVSTLTRQATPASIGSTSRWIQPKYKKDDNSTRFELRSANKNDNYFTVEILYNENNPEDKKSKVVRILEKNPKNKVVAEFSARYDFDLDSDALVMSASCLISSPEKENKSFGCSLLYENTLYIYGTDPQNPKLQTFDQSGAKDFKDDSGAFTSWVQTELEYLPSRSPLSKDTFLEASADITQGAAETTNTPLHLQIPIGLSATANRLAITDYGFDFPNSEYNLQNLGGEFFSGLAVTSSPFPVIGGLRGQALFGYSATRFTTPETTLGLRTLSGTFTLYSQHQIKPNINFGMGGGVRMQKHTLKGSLPTFNGLIMQDPSSTKNLLFAPEFGAYISLNRLELAVSTDPFWVNNIANNNSLMTGFGLSMPLRASVSFDVGDIDLK